MTIDDDAAYRVLLARDARFDGLLFVGVTSTGIYCRPICRVRTPSRRNCRFFASPAQAEAQAFRPCLKCRPEIAPGAGLAWTVMDASRTLARQAACALDEIAARGEAAGLGAVAARLGVSDRHLRRIFWNEHGVTPVQYLQTRRLLLAKQLLTDTRMPMSEVALTSGFRSLRRFNAAFTSGYRMAPTRLRRASLGAASAAGKRSAAAAIAGDAPLTVTLSYRVPFDVDALLSFVGTRAIPGIEAADAGGIRRSVRAGLFGAEGGWLEARFVRERARVRLSFSPSLATSSGALIAAARRWLDLDAAPETIALALAALPGEAGLRVPGSIDAFELAVRAVLGQQVTVAAARTLARRLVERFGIDLSTPWPEIARAFPAPETLAYAPIERIAELGIIRGRAGAVQSLARRWGEMAPLLAAGAAPEALIERLRTIAGIGPWTAHYIAMRALGWPDAFPPNDVAALKAMRQHFGAGSQRAAEAHAEQWRPWRSYAVLRLWNSLGVSA